jgi:cardiolipin synthase
MNTSQLPNLITLARLALAPAFVLVLMDGDYVAALVIFAVAGLSDGVDGFIAKRFHYESRLGAILDPAADKILLVSAYVMLTVLGHLPVWLVIVVAFRDLLIVGGYLLYTSMYGPVHMRPSALSKLNTFMQLALVAAVLSEQAAARYFPAAMQALVYAVFLTTVASGAHYLWAWGVMKEIEPARRARRDE